SAPTFAELFEINELKAQIQEKDTVILKLKEKLKSFSGDVKGRKVEREVEEIETQNLELDHKVTKLAVENEHLKQTYKQLFDSIKSPRVQSKEQYLKEQLKGKAVLTEAVSLNPIDPALLHVDVSPLVPKLHKNRTAHIDYIRHTQEEAATLREIVEKNTILNEIDRLLKEYYYVDHMNAILGVYTELDEVTNLQCDYLEMLDKCECLEKELSKSKMMSESFEALQKHAINLEIDLQQSKEAQIKLYNTREDKELDKFIALENKVKVLDNIVYKTDHSVQTMNMLNSKCRTSFAKPELLKKAQRANPCLYDI
nr:pyruvate, phosphate dikinase regulatory protein, chloroplastic [Tanacetum cinerariifolium]